MWTLLLVVATLDFGEGFARSYEVELHASTIRPIFQRARLKFLPMIDRDRVRHRWCVQHTIEYLTNSLSRHSKSSL